MNTVTIKAAMFGPKRKLTFASPEMMTSSPERTPKPEYCAVKTRSAHRHPADASSSTSRAAFFIKAVINGELALAIDVEDKMIYGEFNHKSTGSAGYAPSETHSKFSVALEPRVLVTYEDDAPQEGNPYEILPYVAAEVLFSDNEEIYETFVECVNRFKKDPADYDARPLVFKFCDAFYMGSQYEFEGEKFDVDDNALSLSTIKEAYKMGHFQDLANVSDEKNLTKAAKYLAENLAWPACAEFDGIAVTKKKRKVAKRKKSAKSRWTEVLKKIKSGDYLLNYDWKPEQLSKVVPMTYLDGFIPTEEFYALLDKIEFRLNRHMVPAVLCGETGPEAIAKDIINVLLYGDPGSGKTSLCHALSAATGMPLYSIKFNEDSEDDVFEGKNKIVEGKISFVGTDFLEGFANGGIILMEEINLGRANMLTSVMNQAMEYPFYIEENGYKKVHRHPLVAAFATMNLDTDGTTALNSAMAQRFANKYMIGEPTSEQFKNILSKDGFPDDRVEFVYGVYAKVRDYLKEMSSRSKYLKEISIRQCKAALYDMEEAAAFAEDEKLDAGHARNAIFNAFYGALCIKSRKLANEIKEGILETYPDYDGE